MDNVRCPVRHLAPDGMFGRAGIGLAGIRATIEPTRHVLASARRAGIRVIYLKMAFRSDLSDADAPNWLKHLPMRASESVTAPDGSPSRVLVRDTWNTEIVEELSPEPGDAVVYKHRYSGFFETELDAMLKGWGIRNLVFTGCTTSVCVESTIGLHHVARSSRAPDPRSRHLVGGRVFAEAHGGRSRSELPRAQAVIATRG